MSTEKTVDQLPIGFIAVSLGINWLLMFFMGFQLHRYKLWLYPLMFILNPIMNWFYMLHAFFTATQRTWGGPRADAAKADENATPQQAIEQAEQAGDDLNVDVKNFKQVVQRNKSHRGENFKPVPLQPEDRFQDEFTVAERTTDGYYLQTDDLHLTNPNTSRVPIHTRNSTDSTGTTNSTSVSIYLPRRIRRSVSPEYASLYHHNEDDISVSSPAGSAELEAQMKERTQQIRHIRTPAVYGSPHAGEDFMVSFEEPFESFTTYAIPFPGFRSSLPVRLRPQSGRNILAFHSEGASPLQVPIRSTNPGSVQYNLAHPVSVSFHGSERKSPSPSISQISHAVREFDEYR
jgi:hypothetical protein